MANITKNGRYFLAEVVKRIFDYLIVRTKWYLSKTNVKIGDIVFVLDENAKRGVWSKGIILSWKKWPFSGMLM